MATDTIRRRQFVIEPIAALLDAEHSASIVPDLTVVRFARRAMATRFEVALPLGTHDALAAAEAALDEIDDCERWMTVYDDDSEVSRLNQHACERSIEVSQTLFELLSLSADLTRQTEGAFDPAIGAMIKAWGFFRREGRLPTFVERAAAMSCSGMRHVALDAASRTVRFLRPGLELNFGSIGKGFALDRAAAVLSNQFGIRSALLHGGGSSIRAIGTPPNDERGWPIRIVHPAGNGHSLGIVYLVDAGFATSAATFQFFMYNGRRYGHVLDPRTGRPADGVMSASVTADTAAAADAISTAMFVAGPVTGEELLRTVPNAGVFLLTDDDRTCRFGPIKWSADPERHSLSAESWI